MIYEWDDAKRVTNLAKHGVDFERVRTFDWDTSIRLSDTRRDYGELRWQVRGFIDDRLHTLVFTERAGRIRVISLRKASNLERQSYEAETHP